ncbi:MAG: GatB/YqeY domain-containing protein [Pseudomonadota bacterium]
MIRKCITREMKEAMKAKDSVRLSTLRLIQAAIKDRDIAARGDDKPDGVSDLEILSILGRMIKQREDSANAYDEAGRIELADGERAEIEIIRSFLPKPLSENEVEAAVQTAIDETGAKTVRDMGKIMGVLKARYPGQMDFAKAGATVKSALCPQQAQ